MQIQQIDRNDPERVQIVVKNVDGSGSITTGLGVALVVSGASIDGISSVKATAGLQKGFSGIASKDIPINGFGLVTAWGVANSVLLSHVGTSLTVTAGDTLIPGAVAGTFFSGVTAQAMSTLLYKYVVSCSTQTISTAGYVTGLIRAL